MLAQTIIGNALATRFFKDLPKKFESLGLQYLPQESLLNDKIMKFMLNYIVHTTVLQPEVAIRMCVLTNVRM